MPAQDVDERDHEGEASDAVVRSGQLGLSHEAEVMVGDVEIAHYIRGTIDAATAIFTPQPLLVRVEAEILEEVFARALVGLRANAYEIYSVNKLGTIFPGEGGALVSI